MVNFKKLLHRTHCTPLHPTLDHNSVKKFFGYFTKRFKVGFEGLHQKKLQVLNDGTLETTIAVTTTKSSSLI
jgi:hypothetical protein